MLVQQILKGKGDAAVVTVKPGAKVSEAARTLAELRIGVLIVSGDGTSIDGILSERDIVRSLGTRGSDCLDEVIDGADFFLGLSGPKVLTEAMVSRMAASRGIELGERSIPRWLADAAGWLCEASWRALPLPGEPPLTRHAAMLMSRDCVLNDAKARRELGYQPVVGVDTGLAALSANAGGAAEA